MENFNLQCFLDAASELVRADEVVRALHLLDNLPGFYRDNIPVEVLQLKREILYRFRTTHDLVSSPAWMTTYEQKISMKESLRGQLIIKDVKEINDKSLVPYIVDFGPGDFFLPELLLSEGLKFNYEPICINNACSMKANLYTRIPGNGPKIFFACEIIEHLWDENELLSQALHGGLPDIIHVSTPKYTFNTKIKDWREIGDLGHLRTYTPKEFMSVLGKMFPDFKMVFYDSLVMHVRLSR